jgi:hypothetical protein
VTKYEALLVTAMTLGMLVKQLTGDTNLALTVVDHTLKVDVKAKRLKG